MSEIKYRHEHVKLVHEALKLEANFTAVMLQHGGSYRANKDNITRWDWSEFESVGNYLALVPELERLGLIPRQELEEVPPSEMDTSKTIREIFEHEAKNSRLPRMKGAEREKYLMIKNILVGARSPLFWGHKLSQVTIEEVSSAVLAPREAQVIDEAMESKISKAFAKSRVNETTQMINNLKAQRISCLERQNSMAREIQNLILENRTRALEIKAHESILKDLKEKKVKGLDLSPLVEGDFFRISGTTCEGNWTYIRFVNVFPAIIGGLDFGHFRFSMAVEHGVYKRTNVSCLYRNFAGYNIFPFFSSDSSYSSGRSVCFGESTNDVLTAMRTGDVKKYRDILLSLLTTYSTDSNPYTSLDFWQYSPSNQERRADDLSKRLAMSNYGIDVNTLLAPKASDYKDEIFIDTVREEVLDESSEEEEEEEN